MRANFINEEYIIEELYIVELKDHYVSINNKPIYNIKCFIFTNKDEAKEESKNLRNKLNGSKLSKVRLGKIDFDKFDWFTINKHTAIYNGVRSEFYNLRGALIKTNPATGDNIFIDQQYSIEEGKKIYNYLHRYDSNPIS